MFWRHSNLWSLDLTSFRMLREERQGRSYLTAPFTQSKTARLLRGKPSVKLSIFLISIVYFSNPRCEHNRCMRYCVVLLQKLMSRATAPSQDPLPCTLGEGETFTEYFDTLHCCNTWWCDPNPWCSKLEGVISQADTPTCIESQVSGNIVTSWACAVRAVWHVTLVRW